MNPINSKTVTQALSRRVRPILREHGFTAFTGKKAWRYTEHTVEIVAFSSFNDYIATGIGCSTISFQGEAGVLFRSMDPDHPPRPPEARMTFRGILNKYAAQPFFHPYGRDEPADPPHVWYVLPDGRNLDEVVEDAARAVVEQGLPHLDRFRTPEAALLSMRTERWSIDDRHHGRLTTFVSPPSSPAWLNAHAALAATLGDPGLDPITAPVLTPAERWSLAHRGRTAAWSESDLVRSLLDDGLEPVFHRRLAGTSVWPEQDQARGPLRIHVYVNGDGSVLRADVY